MAMLPWGFADPFSLSLFDMPMLTPARQLQSPAHTHHHVVQPMDIVETDKSYDITVDVPGMTPDDISLEFSDQNRTLTIRGERSQETKESVEGGFSRIERTKRNFIRSLTVPTDVQTDHITATVEHGVLTVTVPKQEVSTKGPRKISVSAQGSGKKAQITPTST